MNRKQVIGLIVIAIVIAGAWMYRGSDYLTEGVTTFEECAARYPIMESYPEQCNTPDGRHFVRDIGDDLDNLIRVDAPRVDAIVASPLLITGKARGNWYFEASFPAQLIDAEGNVLAQVPAQAQLDGSPDSPGWMTTEFVNFKAVLTFEMPKTETGTLILKKDNPSGLPEYDNEIRIPVRFSDAPGSDRESFGKEVVFKVGRTVVFADGLSVTLTEINDSRCKPGVQCIWAGELAPALRVSGGRFAKSLQAIRLGTVNNTTIMQKDYIFSLRSATADSASIVITSSVGTVAEQ